MLRDIIDICVEYIKFPVMFYVYISYIFGSEYIYYCLHAHFLLHLILPNNGSDESKQAGKSDK